jgi:hypothetical protein
VPEIVFVELLMYVTVCPWHTVTVPPEAAGTAMKLATGVCAWD